MRDGGTGGERNGALPPVAAAVLAIAGLVVIAAFGLPAAAPAPLLDATTTTLTAGQCFRVFAATPPDAPCSDEWVCPH